MFAISRTLTWELCRRGGWPVLGAQCAVLAVAVLVYSTILHSGPLDPQAGRSLHFVLLWIVFVTCGGAALAVRGEPRRLFLLPLSGRAVTAATMLPATASVAAGYMLTATVLNVLFRMHWPVLGPAVYFAAALAVVQAVTQLAGPGRMRQFVAWSAIAIPFVQCLQARYGGGPFLAPRAMWITVTGSEWLAMGSLIVAAFLAMAHGVARERRGDPVWFSTTSRRPVLCVRTSRGDGPEFCTGDAAQFWFEWTQKGWILPSTFAAFAALMTVAYVLQWFDNGEYELLHGCMGYGIALSPVAMIAGLVLGHFDLPQSNAECGSFLGVRPLTDAALSGAALKAIAASLLLTWGLWTTAMIGTTVLLFAVHGTAPVLDLWTDHGRFDIEFERWGLGYSPVLVGSCLVAAWIPLSLGVSLAHTGRQWLLVTFVACGLPIALIGLYLANEGTGGQGVFTDTIWLLSVGAAASLATVVAFAAARKRRLIGSSTCWTALGGWLLLSVLAGLASLASGPWNVAAMVFSGGVLSWAVLPLAAGPLAVHWNRHR